MHVITSILNAYIPLNIQENLIKLNKQMPKGKKEIGMKFDKIKVQ